MPGGRGVFFALVARPVHLHRARPQGPSGRSSVSAIFGFFRPGNPGLCLVSGFFLRPSGCFSVRGSGVLGFVLGRFSGCFGGGLSFLASFLGVPPGGVFRAVFALFLASPLA